MNAFYQAKFNELFREFTRYLTEHPEFAERIPNEAQVVLLDRQDPAYSLHAIESAHNAKKTDDRPDRPVVYIEVTEIAPVRSRLQALCVHESPPAYPGVKELPPLTQACPEP